MRFYDRTVVLVCLALTGNVVTLQGCSNTQPPLPAPHALDDATAASQRASDAMKGGGNPQGHTEAAEQTGTDKANGRE